MDEDEKLRRIAELRTLLGTDAPKVPDYYPHLEQNTNRVLAERGWSTLRWAERNTDISHTTIRSMKQGKRTSAETVIRWARAINEDASQWLVWSGHDPAKYLPAPRKLTQEQILADPLALVGRDISVNNLASVPMIGAGVPATPSRVRDGDGGEYEMEETGVKLPAGARTMEIVGNCMEPLLHEGDVVFVRPASGASSGDIVIALVDLSGITCKVYRVDEAGRSYLEPFAGSGHFSETGDTPRPGEGRIPHDRFSIAGVVMGYFRPIGGAR